MKKIYEFIDKPSNVTFLNDMARAHWLLSYGINKPLLYVSTEDFDGEVFTMEAYALMQPHIGGLHFVTEVDPVAAAHIRSSVWTVEDINEYLRFKNENKRV